MKQDPPSEAFILKWTGDHLRVELRLDAPRAGRAALRTNFGRAAVRRQEVIEKIERGITPLERAWTDIPMEEVEPGRFRVDLSLEEIGVFSGKPCFFPQGSNVPEWPEGGNFRVKVESGEIRFGNSIYCVFPRQFGSFREVVRRLDLIMDKMGFRIIQTLPPFPVPTTYAVMGEYGCPFAATDFYSVDPAMAEFDEFTTPLDQFRELIDAVHTRRGLFFIDLPANHTGWASALQLHHPDWFTREADGRFHSPGAWGVKWADLVELDYTKSELMAYMADVFLFWCRNGVDGFRCDAGYMIPAATWKYIVARVRDEFPDTVFMLEGLGGQLEVTDRLLADANLDWAYSEIFQTYDRSQFEWYLPTAIRRSQTYGTLVHFAETHDNDRLAKGGETYARLRVQLAALLSWQGCWGIANGVEWFATEKIDVHGKNDLNWGAPNNMVELIARLNRILSTNLCFAGKTQLSVITRGEGNVLAVVRNDDDVSPCLVLANLDCTRPASVDWDRSGFPYADGTDLVTQRQVSLDGKLTLAPGEVLCVQAPPSVGATIRDEYAICDAAARKMAKAPEAQLHWTYPQDLLRVVTVPAGQRLEVSAPHHFRLYVVDPQTGRTLATERSSADGRGNRVVIALPEYSGDGTACRRLALKLTVYAPGGAQRKEALLLVPPPADRAKAKLTMTGEEVRRHPEYRAILSNGAGAAAQLRLGWDVIASQYDAFLAANPNPTCPADRLNLWTRTRCWLQREGYWRQLDARCVTRVVVDPAGRGVRWEFHVPCGMGKTVDLAFEATLADGENAARLKVVRLEGNADDVGDQIRLVFRPDLEWRSFHATTKAYQDDVERKFALASRPTAAGVVFAPYDGRFELKVSGCEYHHEPQWNYNLGHAEEAARGQEPAGDLYSPGWISADLKVGDAAEIVGVYTAAKAKPPTCLRWMLEQFSSVPDDSVPETLKRSLDLYIVRRDELKTVIAGYPWFLDWGRDTFIFMRGMIAAGKLADSVRILKAFAAFEENGTLPNIIYGKTAGNRDTTDAQLWFIRCVQEVVEKLNVEKLNVEKLNVEKLNVEKLNVEKLNVEKLNVEKLNVEKLNVEKLNVEKLNVEKLNVEKLKGSQTNHSTIQPFNLSTLIRTCESIVENYIRGTPNGIRMDPDSALVWSPSHFTWMDTNYPACTPRCGYPIEIQALWISALKFLGRDQLAAQALASVKAYFKLKDCPGYADCLDAPRGESAAKARPDAAVRPNQLFLVTLGVLEDASILAATEPLLVPGGVRSLSSGDSRYRGRYEGDEDTSRKPAYHNGTVWAWPFPLYAEALALTKSVPNEVALSLLAGAVENLNHGCLCHLSENADGDAPHAQKGCAAQAWSDSELLRVWLKLSADADAK